MTRRLFHLLTALSLLLCVAVAALWARSYMGADQLALRRGAGNVSGVCPECGDTKEVPG